MVHSAISLMPLVITQGCNYRGTLPRNTPSIAVPCLLVFCKVMGSPTPPHSVAVGCSLRGRCEVSKAPAWRERVSMHRTAHSEPNRQQRHVALKLQNCGVQNKTKRCVAFSGHFLFSCKAGIHYSSSGGSTSHLRQDELCRHQRTSGQLRSLPEPASSRKAPESCGGLKKC